MADRDTSFEDGASAVDESVNDDAGFMAALAGKVGKEVPDGGFSVSPSTNVADGLEFGKEPGEEGAAPVVAEPEKPAPSAPSDEGQVEEGDEKPLHEDPAIDAYLKRYEGDADKALRAAAELTTRFGQQGNELGEARKRETELGERIARLEGRLDERPAPQAQPVTADEIASVEADVEEHGGQATVMRILQTRPELYDHALAAWAEQSPRDTLAASRFDRAYQGELAKAQEALARERAGQTAPVADPDREFLAQQRFNAEINRALETVASDPAIKDWKEIAPFMTKALDSVPQAVAKAVVGQSTDMTQVEAIKMVSVFARDLQQATLREAVASGKKPARPQVISSGARPASETAQKPLAELDSSERISLFKEAFKKADSTSVEDGLTYGK